LINQCFFFQFNPKITGAIVQSDEVNEETLSVDVINKVVEGASHFLGTDQTMDLMKTEYVYPEQADRQSAADWQDAGSKDIWNAPESIYC